MAIDFAGLTTDLVQFSGQILEKQVNKFDIQEDVFIDTGVDVPKALPRLEVQGGPRPYRSQDDTSGNDPLFTDRTLTVYNSKWDFDLDPEDFRNKYLLLAKQGKLNPTEVPFYEFILQYYAKAYLAHLNDSVVYAGSYNASGSTVASIATGFGTMIAAEITATNLTAYATGALTSSNAVTKVEEMIDSLPAWQKKAGFKVLVSYATLSKYRTHYRTLNGFAFNPTLGNGEYTIDAYPGSVIKACSWMGSSARIIIVPNMGSDFMSANLHMGMNAAKTTLAVSQRRNVMECRMMVPIGLQIADLSKIWVNDQA